MGLLLAGTASCVGCLNLLIHGFLVSCYKVGFSVFLQP